MPSTRQLAAILFTDIAGYTAMMQKDETAALAVVRHYMTVLGEIVTAHQGTVVNDYGDGNLCTFTSATQAVRCAIDLQRRLQSEPKVPLRVGLHIGEVIFENEKPFGDGVNVASRIQSLGVANSILFSAEIYSKISNQAEFKTLSLGTFNFKNVSIPMQVFALANEGLVVPARGNMEGKLEPKSSLDGASKKKRFLSVASLIMLVLTVIVLLYEKFLPEPELKSIAVLPFKSLSADPNDQYLADGFYEEIINQLSMQNQLLVISKTSSDQMALAGLSSSDISKKLNVQYLLSGSVRKNGDDLRITTQLEDATTGRIVRTKTLDRKLGDFFNMQGEVALRVVSDVGYTVSEGLVGQSTTSNLKAFEYFQQGHNQVSTENRISILKKAVEEDPTYLQAWHSLASSYLFMFGNRGDSTDLKEGLAAVQRIESIDKNGYTARTASMLHSYWILQDYRRVIREANELLKIIPNSDVVMYRRGLAHRRLGENQEFINDFLQLIRRDPLNDSYIREMAMVLGGNGQTREARKYAAELKSTRYARDYYMISFNCLVLENKFEQLDQLQKEMDAETNKSITENEKSEFKEMKRAITSFYRGEFSEVKTWPLMDALDSAILLRLSGDSSRSRQQFFIAKEYFRSREAKAGSVAVRKTAGMNYAISMAALGEAGWEKIFASIKEGLAPFYHPHFHGSYTYACLLAGKNKEALATLTEWKERNASHPWNGNFQPFTFQHLLKNNPILDPLRSEPGFEQLWDGNHLGFKPLNVPEE